jgi:DNA-binding beta-propeller fold protein YncE
LLLAALVLPSSLRAGGSLPLHLAARVPLSGPAVRFDYTSFDPTTNRLFVSDESGGVETVLTTAGHRIATISLGGEAGNVQYDSSSRRVLADVQTLNEVAVIEPRTNRIVRRVHLANCVNDHSLLVDSPHRLAFIACDGNATLLTLDLRTMQVTGTFKVGSSPDVLAFDSGLRRLYVSSESGVVGVFAETANAVRMLGLAFFAPEAHSVAVDPATHLAYFPLQSGSAGRPQLLIMSPT